MTSGLWVTSKLWCDAHGRDNVEPAIEKTLKDLQLDYLDLYPVHWPIPLKPSAILPGSAALVAPNSHCSCS